jgi:signal transduction histidine kinase/CheY-like chemotaxis protein
VLGQSLDQAVTTRDVVLLPIPLLADSAALIMVNPDGHAGEFTFARTDQHTEEGRGCENLTPELAVAANRLLSGGNAAIEGESVLALPLRVQGRIQAVLVLSRVPSGRRFMLPDIALAETFASRAATVLENARLYREVQQADRQKNEFLSMLAHELRNPLAPIRNANEVLRLNTTDVARIRWAQGVIDRQVTHLVRLVDDLLDVSRLTLGKIRLAVEPVSLQSIVDHAVEASRPLIDQFRHQLEVTSPQDPIYIHGDPTRLTQIITNLLNNSAKYTPAGGRIWLTLQILDRSSAADWSSCSGTVEIRVRDNGVGIPSDLLPRVFEPFTQASRSLERSQGGLGIGLTLVRRLVEMHGGSVEAHSNGPGRGSEFIIRLPTIANQDDAPRVQPIQPIRFPDDRVFRVVVVDDNLDAAKTLVELLSLLGYQVQMAHDGPTGIATVVDFQPDVVLLDIGLPGMNGFEVARRLRGIPEINTVLVAISGYGREEDLVLATASGFDRHFLKPVEFKALFGYLQSLHTCGAVK